MAGRNSEFVYLLFYTYYKVIISKYFNVCHYFAAAAVASHSEAVGGGTAA